MNVQLVDSLVEVISQLSPEEKALFQYKLSSKHLNLNNRNTLTSQERLLLWQEWMDMAPKSYANLDHQALSRENIYDNEV